jgi:hypothetical protein
MLHVLSHHYANNHSTVVIEDLRVHTMSSSAKGTSQSRLGTPIRRHELDLPVLSGAVAPPAFPEALEGARWDV